MKMYNLFEYQNKISFKESFGDLEEFLDEIWNNREKNTYYYEADCEHIESQRFIQFLHKSKELKSNKYVGVIHFAGRSINLLPKIFYDSDREYSQDGINQIHNHILWWLSYCRKIKFPNYQSLLSSTKSDFFEVLIYLFSKFTRELLNSSIYQQYEDISRELPFIKGRLNTASYINENLSRGNWQKLNCTFDAFVFDNEFNRIVKYVTNLLFMVTSSQENKKNLREILFILDEVSDERATIEKCSSIMFNPMFSEFITVLDYCKLFLSSSVSFNYKNELKLFAFLLPMEYVFEDFIFGFIDKELDEISAKSQRSDVYLDERNTFKLKPDLWLKTQNKSLIADTKYKIVYPDIKDSKKGISQSDIYQMLAYAIRFEVDEIILFYPSTLNQDLLDDTEFIIIDTFAEGREISIKAYQLPVINHELLAINYYANASINDLFEESRQVLKKKISEILMINLC